MTSHDLNYERVADAIEFLSQNFLEQPSLQDVAAHVHLSPEHFQRIFTEWAGVSPKKFTQYLTIDYLRSRIHEFSSVQDAADASGFLPSRACTTSSSTSKVSRPTNSGSGARA